MLYAFLRKMKRDKDFRIRRLLLLSLIFNLSYSIFLFVVSVVYTSKWFFVMSIYHGLLSIARIFIFLEIKTKETLRKISLMRACGWFLLLLNVIISVMMFILIYTPPDVKHHEITVITLATYTFSAFTLALINSIKYWRNNHYLYTCVKGISLISAAVSMVTLTNTMLTTFGADSIRLRNIILPIFSAFVSAFIIIYAISMTIKAKLHLRKIKDEEKRK